MALVLTCFIFYDKIIHNTIEILTGYAVMKRITKYIYAIIALIAMATVGIVVGIYSVVISNIVENTTIDNISEIVTHDRNSITMFVEYNWANLKRVGERLKRRADELRDVALINEYLGHEAYESSFDKIFLLMEDGSYYTDISYRDEHTHDYYPFKDLFDGENDKVIGFGKIPVMSSDTAVIYGYRLNEKDVLADIAIGESRKKVSGVIGISKRSTIVEGLVIESFVDDDGTVRGYSSLVNYNGDYIVDRYNTASSDVDNLFEQVAASSDSDLTAGQVEQKIKNGETFWFYQEISGVRRLNYCSPLNGDLGWYFLLSVDDDALEEQSVSFVEMVVAALSIVVLISIAALVIILIMQKKTAKAHAQEKAQSEFLSNMSHEIRTPLNGIIGLNYLMINAVDNPEKQKLFREWLTKSHRTANYLLSLINDILDISKLRAGKVEIAHEPVLVEAIVDSIYSMQCENITSRGVEYITDADITVPCIIGDDMRIKQVLMNIIGNAAKFTPSGGWIKLTVKQELADENRVITSFICEDTGCGMSKEFVAKIFDKFTQERNSNSSSTKGTGLGMTISKLLVNAMGGEIKVESELGKGSKFTITIPAEISDIPDYMKYNVDGEANRIAGKHAKDFKRIKVLIAEDNDLNAEILTEILHDAGFNCTHVPNGKAAVEAFEKSAINEYGVILMDMRMPVLDGCEAASAIRRLDRADAKTVPILACTANTFQEDKLKVFDSGMNDILTKPIDVKVLLRKMECIRNGKNSDGSEKEES